MPWSNTPIDGCSLPNTWQYDQILVNSGRTRLTISDRADSFDGAAASTRTRPRHRARAGRADIDPDAVVQRQRDRAPRADDVFGVR